jgi:hypothetical protein
MVIPIARSNNSPAPSNNATAPAVADGASRDAAPARFNQSPFAAVHGWYRKDDRLGAQVEWLLIPAAGHPLDGVRDTAVWTPERGDAFHLVIGQDEVEHVEIVGDALRV